MPFVVAPLVADQLPVSLEISLSPAALSEAAIYGALTALIFTLWPLARTEHVRAATIFRGTAEATQSWPRLPYLLVIAALVVGLVLISAAFASVPALAFATAGGVLGALVVLALAAIGVRVFGAASGPVARAARQNCAAHGNGCHFQPA